ncbi:MAG: hypothetical protein NTY73_03425 [Candidatus Micrarchaeota archaeon]|nr:hypothetical protein [Candidatus Micrarchaeota archaeon]
MKVYLLLFLSVVALFLVGCVQTGGQVQREYVCPNGAIVTNASQCPPVQQVVEQTDPEMKTCEDMPESDRTPFSDYCYMGLAYKRENATLCKKLSESKRLECYSGLAMLKSDVTICDAAGTQKAYCYSTYAAEKGDVTACDKITEISSKDSCYSQYASRYMDSTVCEKIRTIGQKDSCYMSIASSQCDSSLCNKIANNNTKDNCLINLQYCGGMPHQKPVE